MYQRRITARSAPWPDLLAAIYHAEAAGEGGRPRAGAEEPPGLPAGTRGVGGETPVEFLARGRGFLPVPRGFWCRLGKGSSRRGRGEAFSLAAPRAAPLHLPGAGEGGRAPGTALEGHRVPESLGAGDVARGTPMGHEAHTDATRPQRPPRAPPAPRGAGTPGSGRAAESGEGAWKRLKWGERGEKPRNGNGAF